jgi:hypothetical protein
MRTVNGALLTRPTFGGSHDHHSEGIHEEDAG